MTNSPSPRDAASVSMTTIFLSGYSSSSSCFAMSAAFAVPLMPPDIPIYSTSFPASSAALKRSMNVPAFTIEVFTSLPARIAA